MTGAVSVGQNIGRTRARDLLPGDVVPELGWTTLSSVTQSAFGLVGLETDGGDDLAVDPDRVFQVGREVKW